MRHVYVPQGLALPGNSFTNALAPDHASGLDGDAIFQQGSRVDVEGVFSHCLPSDGWGRDTSAFHVVVVPPRMLPVFDGLIFFPL
jgi:hypothetical protein